MFIKVYNYSTHQDRVPITVWQLSLMIHILTLCDNTFKPMGIILNTITVKYKI